MAKWTVPQADRIIPFCKVITIPAGATPKDIVVELSDTDGTRTPARWYGSPAIAVDDFVRIQRRGTDGLYDVVGADGATAATIDADDVIMSRVGSSTYSTAQHVQNLMHSTGQISGGTITDAGGGSINVAAGTGLIRATDSELAELLFFDWAASSGIAIPVTTTRFIGVEYNAGSPQIVAKTTDSWDYHTTFPLGVVVNSGVEIHILNNPQSVGDHASLMIRRSYATMPLARDERAGGLILGETGTRNLTVSAGVIWDRLNENIIAAIDTSGTDTMERYYQDGGGGWTGEDGETQWPNTLYDDGSGILATINNNWYVVHYFYLESDGNLIMVYGQNQYVNSAGAEQDPVPSSLPDSVLYTSRLIGRLIFKKSAAVATEIQSAFDVTFNPAQAADHGNLAGLGDDDHPQYLLATGARAGASGQAQDYGSNGVKADVIAESTASAGVTISSDLAHTGTNLGVFGTTPTTQPLALTTQLTTITHSAPGTPDYAIADPVAGGYGFTTLDEALTVLDVIENLQARVQELEDKLQALGVIA